MTELDDRMQELRENPTMSWNEKLLAVSGGNLRSAAIADLAFEGQAGRIDLRRAPFAGNAGLKAKALAARDALWDLQQAILNVVWDPETDGDKS